LVALESRLDNVVYRLGFANSRTQARQLMFSTPFPRNGRKVNIPSFLVKIGDAVECGNAAAKFNSSRTLWTPLFGEGFLSGWILKKDNLKGVVKSLPMRKT